jgi:hypothetical protein
MFLLARQAGVVLFVLIACAQLSAATPTQLRIAFGEDPRTSVRIVWQTQGPMKAPAVEYGMGEKLNKRITGHRVTYPYETGVIYEATLKNLKPGTVYRYRVGSSEDGFSRVASFRTAPDKPEDFIFTAFGDHGVTEAARKNVENILAIKPSFHLLLGDVSYANGNQPVWDRYFEQIEPLACAVPIMPTLGNHENEKIKTPEGDKRIGYVAYLARFALPGAETHYTFDYGAARFVAFNSDDYRNPEQLAWLERTLATARKDPKVRWLIVFQHHPLYGSTHRRGNNAGLIATVEPLYDRYKVDLVLAGHDHVYERYYPLRNGQAVSHSPNQYMQGQGTIYVTCGGGGKSLYQLEPNRPAICAIRESTYCYLRVHIPLQGALRVEARRLDGSPLDRFEIQPVARSSQQ